MKVNFSKYFYYDESSPSCLRWKVDILSGKHRNIVTKQRGDIAGSLNKGGYYNVGLKGKIYRAHRIIYSMFVKSDLTNIIIDHIDRNRQNNKISNLRESSAKLNPRNKKMQSDNTSGVTGVSLIRKKWKRGVSEYWCAQWYDLEHNFKSKNFSVKKLGYEEAFKEACLCRQEAIKILNENGAGYSDTHGQRG